MISVKQNSFSLTVKIQHHDLPFWIMHDTIPSMKILLTLFLFLQDQTTIFFRKDFEGSEIFSKFNLILYNKEAGAIALQRSQLIFANKGMFVTKVSVKNI